MSIADVEKTTRKVKGWLNGGGKNKRFGPPGDRWTEQNCDSFRAYLECRGYLTTERKAVDLQPGSTFEDARAKFGRPMRQQKILDEDGYELDATAPIWRYSKRCNISVSFTYAGGKEVESATHTTQEALKSTVGKFSTYARGKAIESAEQTTQEAVKSTDGNLMQTRDKQT